MIHPKLVQWSLKLEVCYLSLCDQNKRLRVSRRIQQVGHFMDNFQTPWTIAQIMITQNIKWKHLNPQCNLNSNWTWNSSLIQMKLLKPKNLKEVLLFFYSISIVLLIRTTLKWQKSWDFQIPLLSCWNLIVHSEHSQFWDIHPHFLVDVH